MCKELRSLSYFYASITIEGLGKPQINKYNFVDDLYTRFQLVLIQTIWKSPGFILLVGLPYRHKSNFRHIKMLHTNLAGYVHLFSCKASHG
jgi:hypothetical protein